MVQNHTIGGARALGNGRDGNVVVTKAQVAIASEILRKGGAGQNGAAFLRQKLENGFHVALKS